MEVGKATGWPVGLTPVPAPGLKVTARTSSLAFRGKEQDIRGIAEALDVKTILEGMEKLPGAKTADPRRFIDFTILDELEKEGFLKTLYKS